MTYNHLCTIYIPSMTYNHLRIVYRRMHIMYAYILYMFICLCIYFYIQYMYIYLYKFLYTYTRTHTGDPPAGRRGKRAVPTAVGCNVLRPLTQRGPS